MSTVVAKNKKFTDDDAHLVKDGIEERLEKNIGGELFLQAGQLKERAGLDISYNVIGYILAYAWKHELFEEYTVEMWSDGNNGHRKWRIFEK